MAPLDNAGNFDRQAVTSAVGTNDPETIDVTDASALPDPSTDQYNLVIWDAGSYNRPDQDPNVEIVRATSRDTTNDTVTVSRAQESTSNASHPSSSEIASVLTAKMISDLDTYLNELADFAASPTEITAPVNNSSTTTAQASITNETLVIVELTTAQSWSVSNTDYDTVEFDSELRDERGEWDAANFQFSPDSDGDYNISYQVAFGSPSDGDNLQTRLQNVDDGTPVLKGELTTGGATRTIVGASKIMTLNSAKTYEVQARNTNSDDSFRGLGAETYFTIRSALE